MRPAEKQLRLAAEYLDSTILDIFYKNPAIIISGLLKIDKKSDGAFTTATVLTTFESNALFNKIKYL